MSYYSNYTHNSLEIKIILIILYIDVKTGVQGNIHEN